MISTREYISDTDATVGSNVAKSVLNGLKKVLGVEAKIALTTDGKGYANKYWNVGNNTDQTAPGIYPMVMTCVHEIDYSKEALVNTKLRNNSIKPLFVDETGASVNVLNIGTENRINIEIRSKSENTLTNLESRLRLIGLQNANIFNLGILYKYYMTPSAIYLVKFLAGDVKLEDYVPPRTDSRFSLISNISGTKAELGFKVKGIAQVRITSDVIQNKVSYMEEDNTWLYRLSISYMYEKPTYMDIKYDYVLKGLVVPDTLFPNPQIYKFAIDLSHTNGSVKAVANRFDYIDDVNVVKEDVSVANINSSDINRLIAKGDNTNGYYIRIPEYDEHLSKTAVDHYTILLSALITTPFTNPISIDGINGYILANLNELGKVVLNDNTVNFMKSEHDFMVGFGESVFRVTVYCNDTQIKSSNLYIDENLNVILKDVVTCEGTIRVFLNIINDAKDLNILDNKRIKDKDNSENIVKDLGFTNGYVDDITSSDYTGVNTYGFELGLPYIGKVTYTMVYTDVITRLFK